MRELQPVLKLLLLPVYLVYLGIVAVTTTTKKVSRDKPRRPSVYKDASSSRFGTGPQNETYMEETGVDS